jgi:hypothetical protein
MSQAASTIAAPRVSRLPHNLDLDDPGPCKVCHHTTACAAGNLACAAFSAFVGFNPKWHLAKREPSRHIFERLFREG